MGGLLQLGVRFLDPSVGRFTQRGPGKDGLNWYVYVGDEPTIDTDPRGLKKRKGMMIMIKIKGTRTIQEQ